MTMSTKWDEDRVRAVVKERASKSPITGLDEVGFVVQVWDHGPPDGRSAKPLLMFDSEGVLGTAGVFASEGEALVYAGRREAGELRRQREIEKERHRRREALSERQRDLWAEQARQKEIAKAANKAAKAADDLARKLADEADDPAIALSCNPSEDGWSLWVAPCWTDGTQEGDPRQLVMEGMGLMGPRKLAEAGAEPKPKGKRGKGKKAPPRHEAPPKLPTHVPDVSGLPLRVGSRVEIPGLDVKAGRLTEIRRQDPDGAFIVEVEDDHGMPREVASSECCKIEGREGEDPTWPE